MMSLRVRKKESGVGDGVTGGEKDIIFYSLLREFHSFQTLS